jgi:hypothetical protein
MAPNPPRKPSNNSPYKAGGSRTPAPALGVGSAGAAPKPGSTSGPSNPNLKTSKSLTGVDPKANDKELAPNPNFKGTPPQMQGDHPNAEPYKGPVMKVEGGSFVPQINMDSMPELDTEVTIEFALEEFSRVMIEIAEQQEDPVWHQQMLAMAQEWHALAATLLQHRVDMESTRGEVELKQQQLVHNDMDHQQKFSQQDQMHQQNMKHQDSMNQMNLQHQDQMNKMGMQNTQMQNQVGMQTKQQQLKQQTQFGDQKNKMALQQQKEIHQTKMQFTKQVQASRMQKMKSQAQQRKSKPSPK